MEKQVYITEEERAKCQKVVDAFEELWQEWRNTKLFLLAKDTSLLGKGYEGIFESLTDEEQAAITKRKAVFVEQQG